MLIEFLVAIGLDAGAFTYGAQVVEADFTPPIVAIRTYDPTPELVTLSSLPLPWDTQSAFETEFRDSGAYYGAFAISKEGAYGYVVGANSIEAAREIAHEECEKHAAGCIIYAEILPVDYQALQPGEVTLSPEATEVLQNPEHSARYRAMAISEDGAYSMVWGYATQAEANTTAMNDCNEFRIHDLPGLRDMPCVLLPVK